MWTKMAHTSSIMDAPIKEINVPILRPTLYAKIPKLRRMAREYYETFTKGCKSKIWAILLYFSSTKGCKSKIWTILLYFSSREAYQTNKHPQTSRKGLQVYKWGFFGLDWNATFVLFFPTSCTFLVGKKGGREQLYKHLEDLEDLVYFENTWKIQVGIFRFGLERCLRTLFPNICYISCWKKGGREQLYKHFENTWKTFGTHGILGKHLERMAYLENIWNTWHTWKTFGTHGILRKTLGTHGILRKHLEYTSGDFSVWTGTVPLYSFSNICYISCWKKGGREQLGTLCILGTHGILRKHLERLVHFENTWNTSGDFSVWTGTVLQVGIGTVLSYSFFQHSLCI